MMRTWLRIGGLAVACAGPAGAAVVTVTDCVNDPHIQVTADKTYIDVAPDDLVLQCVFAPKPGTGSEHTRLVAHDVTIDRGGLTGTGISPSGIDASGNVTATNATFLASDGGAGEIDVVAAGNVSIAHSTMTTGDGTHHGDKIEIQCTGTSPKCTITITDSHLSTRHHEIDAVGDVEIARSTIESFSPLDFVHVRSRMGNVDLSAQCDGGSGSGDCCGLGTPGDECGNTFVGGVESDMHVLAFGRIDATGAKILIAENVCLKAGVTGITANQPNPCDPCTGGTASAVPADVDADDASIRNDFGKKGNIRLCADEGRADVSIQNTFLLDDDPAAGVNDLSTLNECETLPRSGCPHVVGTPQLDS